MAELSRADPCPHCGRFANRGISIDAVIIKGDRILLVKRGIEPFKDFWATPGGFIEWDESAEQAVAREVMEETGMTVTSARLVGAYSSPDRHPRQVINLLHVAEVAEGSPVAGDDAVDVQWFTFDSLPDELAFDHKQNILDAQKFLAQTSM